MKILKLALFCFAAVSNFYSQSFSGIINPNPEKIASIDHVKILAVLVEFQEDKDDATFGDGTFGSIYSQDYGGKILDPLPHDVQYFNDHLSFANDYFSKVSRGKCSVEFQVLDDVLTVSKPMRQYSPERDSDDFSPLADFAKEVWQMADSHYTGVDFSYYNLFVIFHAGVGREFALPGSIGNERDLPSIFMNMKTLRKSFGDDFTGFSVMSGQFEIPNTLVLPETESREQQSLGETNLVELTINGLIAASIGSFLGLPDLFNTETGRSAIGRFGLMDPQSFFAYRGLFPPEPSAWEKLYLGWIDPTVQSPGGQYFTTLTAYVGAVGNDISVVKIPINSTEYFLVENRKRDAYHNGSLPILRQNGTLVQKIFSDDVSGYQSFAVDSIDGVLVEFDEYDWALPGFELNDKEGDPFEDVGLLIWHIDETVINANLETNSVNNDPDRKGVALLEADGITEIGEVFETIFGTEIAEGSKEDTWYQGNPAKRYQNKLSDDTYPNSNSNNGAYSYISIENISPVDVKMSFNTLFLNDEFRQIKNSKLGIGHLPEFLTHTTFGGEGRVFINDSTTLIGLSDFGTVKNIVPNFGYQRPVSAIVGSAYYVIGVSEKSFSVLKSQSGIESVSRVSVGTRFSSEPVLLSSNGEKKIIAGGENGILYTLSLESTLLIDSASYFNSAIQHVVSAGDFFAMSSGSIVKDNQGDSYELSSDVKSLGISENSAGGKILIALDDADNFYTLLDNKIESTFSVESESGIQSFSTGSFLNDGNNYITFVNGNKIETVNYYGAFADNYPHEVSEVNKFVGTPLLVDFSGNGQPEILVFSDDGRVFAFDQKGNKLSGFPISTGSKPSTVPVLFNSSANPPRLTFASVGNDSFLSIWAISSEAKTIYWSGEYSGDGNQNSSGQPGSANKINEYFPEERAYNYPNPIHSGNTYFRFYVAEDSRYEITVFDLSGASVAVLNGEANGGMDNEIPWNVDAIQSGIYFAHISVSTSGGKSAFKNIKVAVSK